MKLHSLADRRMRVLDAMARAGVDRLVCCGNGHHMIDLENPVAHMTGYRSAGPALLVIGSDGRTRLLTSPADECDAIAGLGVDDVEASDEFTSAALEKFLGPSQRTGLVGLDDMPRRMAETILAALGAATQPIDAEYYAVTAAKT
ncbi:unnamed protein product, partial [Phaeothamnion confervicola]